MLQVVSRVAFLYQAALTQLMKTAGCTARMLLHHRLGAHGIMYIPCNIDAVMKCRCSSACCARAAAMLASEVLDSVLREKYKPCCYCTAAGSAEAEACKRAAEGTRSRSQLGQPSAAAGAAADSSAGGLASSDCTGERRKKSNSWKVW